MKDLGNVYGYMENLEQVRVDMLTHIPLTYIRNPKINGGMDIIKKSSSYR